VSESWLRESTTPQVTAVEDKSCTIKYGYFWWLGPACKTPWYAAMGNGGQQIWVAPSQDIVIVTTAGLYNSRTQNRVREVVNAVEVTENSICIENAGVSTATGGCPLGHATELSVAERNSRQFRLCSSKGLFRICQAAR
jgi:hypothetical protein